MMTVGTEDKAILRDLARRYREVAATPAQETLRRRWRDHNGLRPGKPLILAYPEGAWRELLPEAQLQTQNPLARLWERRLRQALYQAEVIHDDQVFDPHFNINWVYHNTGWGVAVPKEHSHDATGSWTWEPPLKALADAKKLVPETVEIDEAETRRQQMLAEEVFADILPVRLRGMFWWSLSVMRDLAQLRGLDQIMIDMLENPEWMRETLAFMVAARLRMLDRLEAGGYLTLNNEEDFVGSAGIGVTGELPADRRPGAPVTCFDLWGFVEAQELVLVSPEMTAEFAVRPHLPILNRFGLNCYGCCEPVHDRLAVMREVPRLRRLSVSPWADVPRCAAELGRKVVLSIKPNPALLASETVNETEIRENLRGIFSAVREHGCVAEVIMKDTHTVRGDARRIPRWVALAREARDHIE